MPSFRCSSCHEGFVDGSSFSYSLVKPASSRGYEAGACSDLGLNARLIPLCDDKDKIFVMVVVGEPQRKKKPHAETPQRLHYYNHCYGAFNHQSLILIGRQ